MKKQQSQFGMFDAKSEPIATPEPAAPAPVAALDPAAIVCPYCGAEARESFRFKREGLYYCQFCPADPKSELGDSQFYYFKAERR